MAGEDALYFLLEKVTTEVLIDYKNIKDGAGYELKQLEHDLRKLEAFLKDSANKSDKTETFKVMERQIRELAYDVEDVIETYLVKKAGAKTKSFLSQFAIKLSTEMEREVKSLREKDVAKILKNFQDRGIPFPEVIKDQSMGQSPVLVLTKDQSMGQLSSQDQSNKQHRVVDFQDESTIMGYLMESKETLEVIAITGMPGLGKTTFARKIFEHEEIIKEFQLRIWIRVSENFNSTNVFRRILQQITPRRSTPIANDHDLRDSVRGCLKNESFLLVMDDVWTKKDWDAIEEILPKNNGKGKVLVTTREKEIAAQSNIYRKPHELKRLGPKESLELLKFKVFDKLEGCPEELENIAQDIAGKCGGVPLTILVIGGILKDVFTTTRSIPTVNEKWSDVSKNVNENLEDDEEKCISDALELSYKRLPHDLRVCFLYTGLFPNNQDIPASTLTQLWIAEGFIPRKDGQSFEQTAEKLLDTLINKNLLMVVKKNLDQVKTCSVHDMIRAFCRGKAIAENLFTEMKISNGVLDPPVAEVPNFRRLCFNSDPTEFLSEHRDGPRVRSLLCFSKESVDLNLTHISTICDAFNKLRVLNCKSLTFRKFPEVERLVLLKHVTVSIGNLKALPKQISQLVNLQTLIVDTTSQSITVKANIWKMIQLRRLKTKATIILDNKNWKGKAYNSHLQTISRLSIESCREALSERARNLKTLGIRGKSAKISTTLPLEKFLHLEKLKLHDLVSESAGSPHPLLNQLECFPPNLKSLTLSNTYLKWNDHMPMLAKMNSLKVLKLKSNAFIGIGWKAMDDGFPKLQFLLIENTKLVNWKASTNHFPTLTSLVVKNCKELQDIPESLADLKYLHKLEIERVLRSVADSARKIELKKQAEQNQNSGWKVPFKLIIGPGCGQ